MSEQQIKVKALYEINESFAELEKLFYDVKGAFERYRNTMNPIEQQTLDTVKKNINEASHLFPSGRLFSTYYAEAVVRNLDRWLPPEIDEYLESAMVSLNTFSANILNEENPRLIKSKLESIQKNMAIVRSKTMSLDSNLPNQQIQALHDINNSLTRLKFLYEHEEFSNYRKSVTVQRQQTLDSIKENILEASKLFPSSILATTVLENVEQYLPEKIDDDLKNARALIKTFPENMLNAPHAVILQLIQSQLDSIQKNMTIVRSETINQTMSLDSNLPNQYFVQTTRQRHT
jgi:hypothetical protein